MDKLPDHPDELIGIDIRIDQEAAKGETPMAIQFSVFSLKRKDCSQSVLLKYHQRSIFKSILMILHVIPIMDQARIDCFMNKLVPLAFEARMIGNDLKKGAFQMGSGADPLQQYPVRENLGSRQRSEAASADKGGVSVDTLISQYF